MKKGRRDIMSKETISQFMDRYGLQELSIIDYILWKELLEEKKDDL